MEGTSFFEVYKRAITEFKDPTLKALLENNTILFQTHVDKINKPNTNNDTVKMISDKFRIYNSNVNYNHDIEGIDYNTDRNLGVRIDKAKLSTENLVGFKLWLSENPITVVYQLSTPEIIDLPHLNKPLKLYQRDNTTITVSPNSNVKPNKMTIDYKDIQDYK